MITMLGFAAMVATTIAAIGIALALDWLLLRAAFALMQPATAVRRVKTVGVEQGARLAARAYAAGK